jgi:ribosomal protein S18 acetylase RimI-like enzyme
MTPKFQTLVFPALITINRLRLQPLDKEQVLAILNWHYTPPYDYYNFSTDTLQEDLCYLLDPGNNFYAMLNSQDDLEGYCSFGVDGQVPGGNYQLEALDMGMGVRPDFTGQGRGKHYAQTIVEYGVGQYGARRLRVTIAEFNKRAQRVWQKLGFEQVEEFAKTGSGERFVILIRSV